jgi:DNA-binding NarL/FixJ family response regulator
MKAIKPTTPIVAFTVLTDPEIRSRMREAGIKRVITKPSEISTMVSALTEAIKYQV